MFIFVCLLFHRQRIPLMDQIVVMAPFTSSIGLMERSISDEMVPSVLSLAPACHCLVERQLQGPQAKALGSEKQLSCVFSKNEDCNILMALSSGLWEEVTWGNGGGGGIWVETWGPLGQSEH